MCLRFEYFLKVKTIYFMLPLFLISCQSSRIPEDTTSASPQKPLQEYIYIPIKRVIFDYYEKNKWRFITQEVEYMDGTHMKSLSSLWVFDFMPVEIIVLDNPELYESLKFSFKKTNGILLTKTEKYLPFDDNIFSEEINFDLPACHEGEFHAIFHIVSSMKFVGINERNIKQLQPWFRYGNIVCIKII